MTRFASCFHVLIRRPKATSESYYYHSILIYLMSDNCVHNHWNSTSNLPCSRCHLNKILHIAQVLVGLDTDQA